MLGGEGAVLIWNDIAPEGRDEFYAWHIAEHMPERAGIPGFRRGRRYIACDAGTAPEFFTLYETDTPQVLVGQDYLSRLNTPTPWTRNATRAFRNTSRALTIVRASYGPGPGGIIATIRFDLDPAEADDALAVLAGPALAAIARRPQVTGAHLCVTNEAASAERTAESRDRTDIQAAPERAILLEGCNPEPLRDAVAALLTEPKLRLRREVVGIYRLEYCRLKTAWSAG